MKNNRSHPQRAWANLAYVLALLLLPATAIAATDDPAIEGLTENRGVGLGFITHIERSPYRGGGTRNDLVPLYLYEGKRVFLEAYRLGLKVNEAPDRRLDVFLAHRFEGFPSARVPEVLSGMSDRRPAIDLGIGYRHITSWGTLFGEVLHDASGASKGIETRLGYRYNWESGNLQLSPQIVLAARDSKLNNYYYGVRPSEATAVRPAYDPGGGLNAELGLFATYRLSERWKLIGSISTTHWAKGVRESPITENRTGLAASLGFAYDFTPARDAWAEGRPLLVKILAGRSTDCDVAKVMLFRCASINTVDKTRIAGVELGRPLIERLNDWPVDVAGYVGVLNHDERGLQQDSLQLNAYIKGYYYGFPWSNRVRTRLGFGVGVSYADRIPFVEMRDQTARNRPTSRVLNYLDPTIDFSVGDLIGVKSMRETYLGLGVSHRSGIFGVSRLLGNVNGGSNYIYTYLEWKM